MWNLIELFKVCIIRMMRSSRRRRAGWAGVVRRRLVGIVFVLARLRWARLGARAAGGGAGCGAGARGRPCAAVVGRVGAVRSRAGGGRAGRRRARARARARGRGARGRAGHVGSAKAIRKARRNFKRALPSPRRSSGCATTQPTSTSALAGSVCRTPCLRALQRLYGSASVCGGSRRHVPGAARRSVLVLSLGQCQPRRRAHASSAPWIFSPDCCSRFLLRRPQPGCGASPRDLPAGRLALPNRARCWRVGHRYVCAPHRLRKGRRLHRGHEWSLPLEPRRMHVRMHV